MILFFFSLLALAALPKEAMDPIYDEYEGVELASALLRDGKVPAARMVWADLSSAEKSAPEAQFLLGNLFSAEQNFAAALTHYSQAEGQPKLTEQVAIQKAKAHFALGQLADCTAELKKIGNKVYESSQLVLLRSNCEKQQTLQHLSTGETKIQDFALFQEKIQFLLKKKLFLVARSMAFERLERSLGLSEILRLAEIFQTAQRWEEAQLILENAKVRFPLEKDVLLALAPLYHRQEWRLATIAAFEGAALTERKYFEHSAELNRQAGQLFRSLQQIPLVPGEREKLRLQLANYVDRGRWDLVSSLDTAIRRSDLREDGEVNYALAFSLARLGKITRAKEYLAKVQTPSLLPKATQLRKILEDCKNPPSCGW
jgi:hypothetical protein